MFIVICKFRDDLPSSFLDATFGERLFKPKHVLKNVYARGTQREYSSEPHKHSIVERTLVFKR